MSAAIALEDAPARRSRLSAPIEIDVQHLRKSLGGRVVLADISFRVRRGEMVALIGGSGCGKTTVLRHLTGHFIPDSGTVLIADHESDEGHLVDVGRADEAELERLQRHWAFVFQRNGLLPGTIFYNVALPLRVVQQLDEAEVARRVGDAIVSVSLRPQDADLNVESISGGMAKRVALARALALDPTLIFYDEPTASLDPFLAEQIGHLIWKMHGRPTSRGDARTTVIVTHDTSLLARLRPRVLLIEGGRVAFDGSFTDFARSGLLIAQTYLAPQQEAAEVAAV